MKARILIVDDEPEFRNLVAITLQRFGYEVLEAGSGHAALDVAKLGDDALINYMEHHVTLNAENYPHLELVEFTPEEMDKWRAAARPVQQEYIDMLAEKGVDGQKLLDRMNELFAIYNEDGAGIH